jgi:hypothetical protein
MLLVTISAVMMLAQPPQASKTAEGASQGDVANIIAQSTSIGRMLYAFDRAAWVSSDALTENVPHDQLEKLGGYIVEIAAGGLLRVTHYRGNRDNAEAAFVTDVRDEKVVRSEVLTHPVPLQPSQMALVRARAVAAQRAKERNYKPCTAAPFNTVVLPSRDNGPVAVYLLSAQLKADAWPMGGNYRVIVAPNGTVLASRPYSVSCLNVPRPRLPAGATAIGFAVSHLLDPAPTELHVFASYNMHTPIFVTTPDKKVWKVEGRNITLDDGSLAK